MQFASALGASTTPSTRRAYIFGRAAQRQRAVDKAVGRAVLRDCGFVSHTLVDYIEYMKQ